MSFGSAYRQVKGRLDLAVTDLGRTQLKNIVEPIRAYSLEVGRPAQTTRAALTARLARTPLVAGIALVAIVVAVAAAILLPKLDQHYLDQAKRDFLAGRVADAINPTRGRGTCLLRRRCC